MSIEAMRQALEALENHMEQTRPINMTQNAIHALRQAIEQAEKQEPVAWEYQEYRSAFMGNLQWFDTVQFVQPPNDPELFRNIKPLYTAPPRKPWVGLNWDDIPDVFVGDIAFMQGAKWALAKLKEKNGG